MESGRINITYWSDFVCPFCYIGTHNLHNAICELGVEDRFEICDKSFELDRYAPVETFFNAQEHFAMKYELSAESAKEQVERISQAGCEAGICGMDYAGTKTTNTLMAHNLARFAREEGIDIKEQIFRAFFCDLKNIGRKEVLLDIAVQAGLDREKAEKVINEKPFTKQIRSDEAEAKEKGIHKVPHFIINGTEEISGSLDKEGFREILEKYL